MAIQGARRDWNGRGMRSPSRKRFFRNSCVSATWGRSQQFISSLRCDVLTVDGPPMFNITSAVTQICYNQIIHCKELLEIPVGLAHYRLGKPRPNSLRSLTSFQLVVPDEGSPETSSTLWRLASSLLRLSWKGLIIFPDCQGSLK